MRQIVIPEKIVSGGNCIAKINGKTVFIPFAIPGEKIEIEITKSERDFDEAKIVSIIEPSFFRVKPFCDFYGPGKCGGCDMQHIDFEHQKKLRSRILKNCFLRNGIEISEDKTEIISASEKNYRAKVQLTNGGFCERKSNNVIFIKNCPIAAKEINNYLENTSLENRPKGRVNIFGDKRITFKNKLVIGANQQEKDFERGKSSKNKTQFKSQFQNETINEKNICELFLCGQKIKFDVNGFFQSNIEVLEKTLNILRESVNGKNLLDMYGGVGTFSAALFDNFKKTTLVEKNKTAVMFAEINLSGKNHQCCALSGKNWIKTNASFVQNADEQFDTAIIDPPRAGIEKEVRSWLCENKIKHLISVSCDPATQARDCAEFVKSGYKISKIYLADFYPQTSNIESMVLLDE